METRFRLSGITDWPKASTNLDQNQPYWVRNSDTEKDNGKYPLVYQKIISLKPEKSL